MTYHYVAASIEGFVQQLAVAYVQHGYWFYVTGVIPEGKDVAAVDRKLMERYGIAMSKWARARRKAQGLANVHYLRHGHTFVLLATKGRHEFWQREANVIRDIRRVPIVFAGYSIGYRKGADRKWHVSVRIHPSEYNKLKSYFLDLATRRAVEPLLREFASIRFEPYAAIRRQLFNILRAVNRTRKTAGYERIPTTAIRLNRRPVKVFVTEAARL